MYAWSVGDSLLAHHTSLGTEGTLYPIVGFGYRYFVRLRLTRRGLTKFSECDRPTPFLLSCDRSLGRA